MTSTPNQLDSIHPGTLSDFTYTGNPSDCSYQTAEKSVIFPSLDDYTLMDTKHNSISMPSVYVHLSRKHLHKILHHLYGKNLNISENYQYPAICMLYGLFSTDSSFRKFKRIKTNFPYKSGFCFDRLNDAYDPQCLVRMVFTKQGEIDFENFIPNKVVCESFKVLLGTEVLSLKDDTFEFSPQTNPYAHYDSILKLSITQLSSMNEILDGLDKIRMYNKSKYVLSSIVKRKPLERDNLAIALGHQIKLQGLFSGFDSISSD
jgi:hypothetical protein